MAPSREVIDAPDSRAPACRSDPDGSGRRLRAGDRAPVPLRHRQGPHRPLGLHGHRRPPGGRLEHDPRPLQLGAPRLRHLQVRRPRASPRRAGALPAPLRRAARLEGQARRPRVRRVDDRHRGLDRRKARGPEAPGRLLRVPLRRHEAPPFRRAPAARGARRQGVVERLGQRRGTPRRLLDLRRHLPPRVPRGSARRVHRARGDRRPARRCFPHGRPPESARGRGTGHAHESRRRTDAGRRALLDSGVRRRGSRDASRCASSAPPPGPPSHRASTA